MNPRKKRAAQPQRSSATKCYTPADALALKCANGEWGASQVMASSPESYYRRAAPARSATGWPVHDLLAIIFGGDQQKRLVALVIVVLGSAFLTVAILSYAVSRERLRDLISSKELPLTSDLLNAEIQRDFAKPLQASSVIANDTFLRDWALSGERDIAAIQKFLGEMQRVNTAFTAYFVSEQTHHYYIPRGTLKTVSPTDSHDGWFFDLEHTNEPYVVQVDTDQTHDNALMVFVNYRVLSYDGRFLGIAGLGLNVNAVRTVLDKYEEKFGTEIFFVDRSGHVVMSGGGHALAEDVTAEPGLSTVAHHFLSGHDSALEYVVHNETHFLNARYIPDLNWYLIVDRREEAATENLRKTLYLNILIATIATAIVATILAAAVGRFQRAVERAGSVDSLTQLTNRRAFNILFHQASKVSRRANRRLSIALIDIDHLKQTNDRYGHIFGDQTIQAVAGVIESHSRDNDIACRWGGAEFLLVMQDCPIHRAMGIADDIRKAVADLTIPAGHETVTVTVTIGVAELFPSEGEDSLVARADEGLQAAKRAGRNCVISSNRF